MDLRPKIDRCPSSGTPYLVGDFHTHRERKIQKARCKLWTCDYCKYVNAHQHYIRVLDGSNELLNRGHELNFVTITSNPKLKDTNQCLFVWRKSWRKLRARLARLHARDHDYALAFVLVTEKHKDGRLHWHGIINNGSSTRWWKDNASECGLGHQCRSEKMDNAGQCSSYVTKYLSKSLSEADYPKKMRRIVYSQSFPNKPVVSSTGEWSVLPPEKSLVEAIEEAWFVKKYDAYLDGKLIEEILEN